MRGSDAIHLFLKEQLNGCRRLAILGVGSTLRADDAAGVMVVQELREALKDQCHPELLLCEGETAPENYTGKIAQFQPTHLLVIDAADLGGEPGDVRHIRPEDVGGPSFCSHMLPLKVMIRYIVEQTDAAVTLLGIQYGCIDFDADMTPPVASTVRALADALLRLLQ